jgi:hypothetical protein
VCKARQRGQLRRGRLVGVAMGESVASSAHDGPHVGRALDQAFQDGGERIDAFLMRSCSLAPSSLSSI